MIQLDLFMEAESPEGIEVYLPDPCQCSTCIALIGPGAGPHRASLHCRKCERHRGWLSSDSFEFITTIINKFGRPRSPIIIRRGKVGWIPVNGGGAEP